MLLSPRHFLPSELTSTCAQSLPLGHDTECILEVTFAATYFSQRVLFVVVETDFRPVQLDERYAVLEDLPTPVGSAVPSTRRVGLRLYDAKGDRQQFYFIPSVFSMLTTPAASGGDARVPQALDPTLLSGLCFQLWSTNRNGIVFCSSKRKCVEYARLIARSFQVLRAHGHMQGKEEQSVMSKRQQLLETLRQSHFGLDPVLQATVPEGVGFHHAGLSFSERSAVEDAYRAGTLFVLCATTTLACGINIGAFRVIFTSLQVSHSLRTDKHGIFGRDALCVGADSRLVCAF